MLRPFAFMGGDAADTAWRVSHVTGWDQWKSTTGDTGESWNYCASGVKYDDDDYIYNGGGGAGGAFRSVKLMLESITDPGTDTGFTIKIKHEAYSAGAALDVQLHANGTRLKTYSPTLVLNTPTEEDLAIDSAEMAQVTDFSDVELKLINAEGDAVRVYYLYIETP